MGSDLETLKKICRPSCFGSEKAFACFRDELPEIVGDGRLNREHVTNCQYFYECHTVLINKELAELKAKVGKYAED